MRKRSPNLYEILKGSRPAPQIFDPSSGAVEAKEAIVEKLEEVIEEKAVQVEVEEEKPRRKKRRGRRKARRMPAPPPPPPEPEEPEEEEKVEVREQPPEPMPMHEQAAEPLPLPPHPTAPPPPMTGRRVVVRPAQPDMPRTDLEDRPGERTLTFTYNTLGFMVLVFFGLVFISYSMGVKKGRAEAAVAGEGPVSEMAAGPESPAAETGAVWSIYLMHWDAETERDRVSNKVNAQKLTDALRRRGLKKGWHRIEKKGETRRVVLYYGRYTEDQEDMAIGDRAKLRAFKLRSKKGTYQPFPRCDAVRIGE